VLAAVAGRFCLVYVAVTICLTAVVTLVVDDVGMDPRVRGQSRANAEGRRREGVGMSSHYKSRSNHSEHTFHSVPTHPC
jgi:hypothetical protein